MSFLVFGTLSYRICRIKRRGGLIFGSNKKSSKTHQNPSVLCTPPFEKSSIKAHRFCVLSPVKNHPPEPVGFVYSPPPPLKNHPPEPVGFVYSPLWRIIHENPSVLCTPPFEESPMKIHRFCVLPPLKNHCFWWVLISEWAFISANTVFESYLLVLFFLQWVRPCRRRVKRWSWFTVWSCGGTLSACTNPRTRPTSKITKIRMKFSPRNLRCMKRMHAVLYRSIHFFRHFCSWFLWFHSITTSYYHSLVYFLFLLNLKISSHLVTFRTISSHLDFEFSSHLVLYAWGCLQEHPYFTDFYDEFLWFRSIIFPHYHWLIDWLIDWWFSLEISSHLTPLNKITRHFEDFFLFLLRTGGGGYIRW